MGEEMTFVFINKTSQSEESSGCFFMADKIF
jgi:hypothetical protein